MKKQKEKKENIKDEKPQLDHVEEKARSKKKSWQQLFKKKNQKYFLALVVLLIVILPIGLYFYSPLGKLTYRFFRYLPYPVVMIDDQAIITTREMIAGAEAMKTFYQSQDFSEVGMRIDFTTEEGKMRLKIKEKDVLDKLVENGIIEKLALERGITITAQEAQREINQKIAQSGDAKALEMNLKKLYNWSMDDFRDKVVVPQLYLQKLSEYYFEKDKQSQVGYQKIQEAHEALQQKDADFEQVAKKYSQGQSAATGGELGWFRQEQLVPEVAAVAFELKPKTISPIIQSSLGYHIIQVQEIRDVENTENSSQADSVFNKEHKLKEVRLRQIFISEGGFLDWLKAQKRKTKIYVLMKDYVWDQDQARIKFREEKLNVLEADLKFKAEGDPSMQ